MIARNEVPDRWIPVLDHQAPDSESGGAIENGVHGRLALVMPTETPCCLWSDWFDRQPPKNKLSMGQRFLSKTGFIQRHGEDAYDYTIHSLAFKGKPAPIFMQTWSIIDNPDSLSQDGWAIPLAVTRTSSC